MSLPFQKACQVIVLKALNCGMRRFLKLNFRPRNLADGLCEEL